VLLLLLLLLLLCISAQITRYNLVARPEATATDNSSAASRRLATDASSVGRDTSTAHAPRSTAAAATSAEKIGAKVAIFRQSR